MHSSSTMVLLVMISIFWTSCQGLESITSSTISVPVSLALNERSTVSETYTSSVSMVPTATQSSSFENLSTSVTDKSTFASISNTGATSDNTTSRSAESPTTDNSSLLTGSDTTTPGTETNQFSMATESLSTINSSTTYVSSTASSLPTTNIINVIDVTINGSSENATGSFTTLTTFNASEASTAPSTSSYYDLSTTATGETSTSSVTNSTSTSNNASPATATSVTSTMLTYTTGNSSTNQSGIAGNDKDSVSTTGVILGAIFGSILGIALVCIVAYVLCGTRKPKEFSHRRLYEDIRTDPVLRLDNPVSPYDVSYGDSSFFNPAATEEMPYNGGRTHETIVMEDLRTH